MSPRAQSQSKKVNPVGGRSQSKKVNPVGGSGSDDGRDSACTPKWVADLIGAVGIDPCSNPRSHILATFRLSLESGCDGLLDLMEPGLFRFGTHAAGFAKYAARGEWTSFVNPPYARGEVIRWVRHWRHTRFSFLLRWDPRTKWFRELWPHCTHVWFPQETEDHPGRIEFEPPPGVTFTSNPFPHALYLRDPSPELLARLAPHGVLLSSKQCYDAANEVYGRGVVPANSNSGGSGGGSASKPVSGRGTIQELVKRTGEKWANDFLRGRTVWTCQQCNEDVYLPHHGCSAANYAA